jgi:2-keto-3-deoxy-6-phosphogluconate aldolase
MRVDEPAKYPGRAFTSTSLKAPFPDVPFVAAGGVNQHTAAEIADRRLQTELKNS